MKKIILLFSLISCHLSLKAQPAGDSLYEKQIKIDFLTVDDGLSQGNIFAMVQDKNGFMWFGTTDGLNKYDGYRFTVYRHEAKNPYSISKNFIIRIVADPRGFLWIAYSDLSMAIFNPETERAYRLKNPDTNQDVKIERGVLINDSSGICYNSDGIKLLKLRVWYNPAETDSKIKVQPEDVTGYLPEKTSPSNRFSIFISSKNKMYVSYCDSVFVYPDADITNPEKAERFSRNYFSQHRPGNRLRTDCEVICAEDTLHHRLISSSTNSFTIFDERAGIKSDSAITSFGNFNTDIDRQGRLWMLSDGSVVYDPVHKKFTRFFVDNTTISKDVFKSIQSFYSDKGGTIWMGTSGYGILKYNLATERFVTIRKGGERFSINRMWEDTHADRIWLHSYGTTPVFFYDKSLQQLVPVPESFTAKINKAFAPLENPILSITALCSDGSGYWLAKDSTVVYADKNLNIINSIKVNSGLTYWEIKMNTDHSGNLWITTGLGKNYTLRKFNKDSNKETGTYPFPVSPLANGIPFASCILPDENNNLWFATLDGLYFFNTTAEKWSHYMHHENDSASLPSNDITTLCNDLVSENILWLGTNGSGFVKFDKATGKSATYTVNDGLPNHVIYGILPDKYGNIWMSTNNGLSRFSPQSNSFKNFSSKDGLQGNEFNRFAYCKMQSGEMAFGGLNGFNVFNPDELVDNPYQPHILFTGFKIGNKEVTMHSKDSLLSKAIFATREVHLIYSQNFITFSFTSSDYSAIEKNRFQYRLAGMDNDWQPATKLNEATYTNLDPGTYTFKVRGTNSDGVWSTNEASINIFISPPWWATWWFRTVAAVTAVAAVYMFYSYRLKQALKIANLRNSIARDLHDEIGSTLSSISFYGESAKMMLPGEHPVSTVLSKISESTSNMNESMSDIVWAINTRNDQFDNLANRMEGFANKVMDTKGASVFFETNNEMHDLQLDMEQRKNLYLLYKEIVNNAGKHSGCKNLWIKLNSNNSFLNLSIKDDGKGFNADESDAHSMGGNGMFNMKKRAADLHAEMKIESAPGAGTEVILNIRL